MNGSTDRHDEWFETVAKWHSMYTSLMQSGARKTFRQAEALFHTCHGYWMPRDMPLTPKDSLDWGRLIFNVSPEDLR
jgi:hypothetical protein